MLTVEDGTGLENAESYESVANADIYAAAFGRTEFLTLDTTAKEVRLRKATRYIDAWYTPRGCALAPLQGLSHPRGHLYVNHALVDGLYRGVRQACCELATYPGLPELFPEAIAANLKSRSRELEGIKKKDEYFEGTTVPRFRQAEGYLAPVTEGSMSSGISFGRIIGSL